MNTQVIAVPANLALPAHLQTPQAAAQIAAANAAAAGGIKIGGGFPKISIEGNKFSEVDGDEVRLLINQPTAPGQPALPMMCLEIVAVSSNPAVSRTYFKGAYVKGQEAASPDCRSSNGVTPDADVVVKQSAACAGCEQSKWGSKISALTGKEIPACDSSKQLAVLPAQDLAYKALGLRIQKGSLKNWGLFVDALTQRNYPVDGLVINVTFDAQQTGVLNFSFNRFLTEAESIKVAERAQGSDVKNIVAQSRVALPALPAPASTAHLPGVTLPTAATVPLTSPAPLPPQGVQFPPETTAAFAPPPVQPAPAPVAPPAPVDPFADKPAYVRAAVAAAGGLGTADGNLAWAQLTMSPLPIGTVVPGSFPAGTPSTSAPPPLQPVAMMTATPAPAATGGFGAVAPPAAATPPAEAAPARKRRTRAEIDADNAAKGIFPPAGDTQYAHLPAEAQSVIKLLGPGHAASVALIAQYAHLASAATPVATPPSAVSAVAAPPVAAAPVQPAPAATGFGMAPPPTGAAPPVAPVVSTAVGESLRDKLMAKLGKPVGAT